MAKKKSRSIRLLRPLQPSAPGVFAISDGARTAFYVFHEIPCDIGGRGFAVHRLGLGEVYDVRVGAEADCSCECLGFLRHSQCKHILGLLALMEHGLIPWSDSIPGPGVRYSEPQGCAQ